MRRVMIVLTVPLVACGRIEREREAAADSARAATIAEIESLLAESVGLTDSLASAADRILSPMPVMTPAEEDELRRFQNASHVARAQALGVRVLDDAVRDSLLARGRLIELEDSTEYWIVRPRTSPAQVVPDVRALLELLGERFHRRLAGLGLPAYRMEVTSSLRTAREQARLRRSNANAATGVSSHEFGTTVDLSYAAFAPPTERPEGVLAGVPPGLRPHLEHVVDLSLESVSARKSREIGRIFGRVLAEAQAEGLALVIFERQQTVYHVTVARRMVP